MYLQVPGSIPLSFTRGIQPHSHSSNDQQLPGTTFASAASCPRGAAEAEAGATAVACGAAVAGGAAGSISLVQAFGLQRWMCSCGSRWM